MKIDRPGGPTPPPTDGTEGVEGPAKTDKPGESFADKLGGPGGPSGPGGPGGPSGPGGPDPIADIAADLKAGRITPEQAVDRVVEAAAKDGIPDAAPEKVRAELREQLLSLVGDDPYLASKARRIGVKGGDED